MSYEGLATYNGEQSLAPLVEKTTLLTYKNGHIVAPNKLTVPTSEFGVPDPQALIKNVLGRLSARHVWTGHHDVHHVAWPQTAYQRINVDTDSDVGGFFRGAAALKVRMPRQLHNFIHAVTEPPVIPAIDVMRQWTIEQRQVDRLYDTVRRENMQTFDLTEEQREKYRFSNFQQKLELMQDGELGLMPDREYLAAMDIETARRTL